MNTDQILKVLKNERECIARQSRPLGEMPQCRKDEDGVKLCEYCDLCLPDDEILEVYDFLIEAYSITEIHINVSQEEADKLIEILNRIAKEGTRLAAIPYPDTGMSYPTVTFTTKEDNGTKKCADCEHALYFTKRDEELGIVGGCDIGFPCNEDSEGAD